MANKELVEYIKKVRKLGHRDEAIVSHLKKHGYPEHVIDKAFNELNKKLDFVFVIMIILILSLIGVFMWFIFHSMNFNLFKPNPLCEQVEIQIFNIDSQTSACIFSDSSRIQLMIENTGKTDISNLEFKVSGSRKKVFDNLENINLKPGDIFPKVINYDSDQNGQFKNLKILPKVQDKISCKDKAIFIESLRNC